MKGEKGNNYALKELDEGKYERIRERGKNFNGRLGALRRHDIIISPLEGNVVNIAVKRWRYAFPMTNFWPVLSEPSRDDQKLAEQYCPILYVDPDLFKKERGVLARYLDIKGVPAGGLLGLLAHICTLPKRLRRRYLNTAAEVIYHFCASPETDTRGALLWTFSQIKRVLDEMHHRLRYEKRVRKRLQNISILPPSQSRREYEEWVVCSIDVYQELVDQLSEVYREGLHNKYVAELFYKIFQKSHPTCVIKYNVLHHPIDPLLCCIQYFVYWPIQIIPPHFFDYEPVYVFIRKMENEVFEPILITFNAASNLARANLNNIRYLLRKRPGHLIRTFFNWDIQYQMMEGWEKPFMDWPRQYNRLGDVITRAFSGQYMYEELPEVGYFESYDENNLFLSHVNQVLKEEGRPTLHIPNYWHAFDVCDKIPKNTIKYNKLQPQPLTIQDLLHIEWNITNPFQPPFLYPIVGGKAPIMHFPVNLKDLIDRTKLDRAFTWLLYCDRVRSLTGRWTSVWDIGTRSGLKGAFAYGLKFESYTYRAGQLVNFLYSRQGKTPRSISRLWQKIDYITHEYDHTRGRGYKKALRKYYGITTDPIDQSPIMLLVERDTCPICNVKMDINPFRPQDYFCSKCGYERWLRDVVLLRDRLKKHVDLKLLTESESFSLIDKLERVRCTYFVQNNAHAAHERAQEFVDEVEACINKGVLNELYKGAIVESAKDLLDEIQHGYKTYKQRKQSKGY